MPVLFLILRAPRRAGRSERRPFPEWASYERNSIWIYDTMHFARCPAVAVITVMDLVTRKWICEVVSGEETRTQVEVAFWTARARGTARTRRAPPGPPLPGAPLPLDAPLSPRSCSLSVTTGRR